MDFPLLCVSPSVSLCIPHSKRAFELPCGWALPFMASLYLKLVRYISVRECNVLLKRYCTSNKKSVSLCFRGMDSLDPTNLGHLLSYQFISQFVNSWAGQKEPGVFLVALCFSSGHCSWWEESNTGLELRLKTGRQHPSRKMCYLNRALVFASKEIK